MALDGKKSFYPPHELNLCDPEAPVFVFTDGACEPADDGSYVALVGGVLMRQHRSISVDVSMGRS